MTSTIKSNQWAGLAGWLIVCYTAAAIGAVASAKAVSFYEQLTKADWAPPAFLFGPVWSVLFLLMSIAAWLVWKSGGFGKHRTALTFFMVQLVFNALWSWLFFAWHQGGAALIEVIVLWVLIATTTILFWRVRPLAGALLVPYLAWVSFASVLNYSLWQLNPVLLG